MDVVGWGCRTGECCMMGVVEVVDVLRWGCGSEGCCGMGLWKW